MDNITKRQHYVPQFYLKQFVSDNDTLYCYRKTDRKSFPAHPNDVCFRNYGYEVKTSVGNNKFLLPNDIEKMFCSLEGEYCTVLKSVVKKCLLNANGRSLICTSYEKTILASMISNFIVRNFWAVNDCIFEEESQFLLQSEQEIGHMDNMLRELNMGSVKPFLELAQKRLFMTPSEDGVAHHLITELLNMNLSFFVSNTIHFVTSDCPVAYNCSEDTLFMARIPLSPHVTAIYSTSKTSKQCRNKCEILPQQFVEKLNSDYLTWDVSQTIISISKEDIDLILNQCN